MAYHRAIDLLVIASCLLWLRRIISSRHKRGNVRPLPPGPKPLPVIGNLLDMQMFESWLVATKWRKIYGDIVSISALGKTVMYINSYDIAVELFEKRSTRYSDRPENVMFNELQHWDWSFVTKPYGEAWKEERGMMTKSLSVANLNKYRDIQRVESARLLAYLLHSPENFISHIRMSMASVILTITYGHEVTSHDDPMVSLSEKAISAMVRALDPSSYLVNTIPLLKYVPEWIPGASFQKIAREGRVLSQSLRYDAYEITKKKFFNGGARPSIVTNQLNDCIERGGLTQRDDDIISAVSGFTFGAGADTTVSLVLSFILAMLLHPTIQQRAQKELDEVVGTDRLPDYSDRPNLPYCEALLKETMRWQPIAPQGVAHSSKEDDEYGGYLIPAGTTIIPNQWAMSMDPVEYPEPDIYRPERFLPAAGERMPLDPAKIAFGFGRRICPGRLLAENTGYLAMVRILSTFDIRKAIGPDGKKIEPSMKFTTHGTVRQPEPFECSIKPRSKKAITLIEQQKDGI